MSILAFSRSMRITISAVIMVLVTGIYGCGCRSTCSIEGQITVDGQPMSHGNILFVSLRGAKGVTGGEVKNGRYSVSKGLSSGTYRVEIKAPRQTNRLVPKPYGKPDEMVPEVEESVAAEANTESQLSTTVVPGSNTADFTVRSRLP